MSLAIISNKINPILKKANYIISIILVLIFFLVLMIHLNREVRDLDIWLHLKTGEQIILNKEVALSDPFSFTKENHPWVNHEWLFQLLSYSIYSRLGFDGLIALQNAIFIAIFLMLFFAGIQNKNFLFISSMLFILLLNSSYRFTIRPDMFSVLFLVLFILILKDKRRYIYLLPLIQIIWTNLHGFFLLGPLVIFIFALFERNKKLWRVFTISLCATLINPQFITGVTYPIFALINLYKDNFSLDFIQELSRPLTLTTLFNINDWFSYKAMIIISLFSFRFNQKRINPALLVLWMVFLLFSLAAIRNIIYFAIVAIIAIFHNVKERISSDNNLSNVRLKKNKYYYFGRFSLIFAFSFCMIKNAALNAGCSYYDFNTDTFKSCLWGVSSKKFPEKAVDFIIGENLPLNLFNDFNSGSYLIGRAFPKRKVFVDGRTEFYGGAFLKEYKKATKGDSETIKKLISKYKLDGFLLTMSMSNFDEKLAKYLYEDPEWIPIYFDESAMIFLINTSKNQVLIRKFKIELESWSAPKANLQAIGRRIVFPYSYIRRGSALREIGCFESAISEAKEALKIMPDCAEAFELLGSCYFELKNYLLSVNNYAKAVTLKPENHGWRNKFALALYKSGNLSNAKLHLKKLIKARPNDPENYHALCIIFKKENGLERAEKMISKACALSKNDNLEYLRIWAELLFDLKRYNKTLEIYRLIQKAHPLDSKIESKIKKLEKFL